jgi:hypothetical protein
MYRLLGKGELVSRRWIPVSLSASAEKHAGQTVVKPAIEFPRKAQINEHTTQVI